MKNGQLMASLLWEMVIVYGEMRGEEKEEGKDGGN